MAKKNKKNQAARPKFYIKISKKKNVKEIVKLINEESARSGALLKITPSYANGWIKNGLSLIATTKEGKIVGHIAAYVWLESGWIELRSSVVRQEFRGNGIASRLTKSMAKTINKKYHKRTLVAFTNKAGSGKGILKAMGFNETDYELLPKELFTIGPKYRGKKEFGYKIFVKY